MMIETLPELKVQKIKPKQNDVLVIIILYKNPEFKGILKPYNLDIYGQKMWQYVENACSCFEVKKTFANYETDIISQIQPLLTNAKTTIVLFSDTPLIQENTLQEILASFESQNLSFMTLSRGYVFKKDYLKELKKIPKSKIERFNEEDFITVFDAKQYEFVSQIVKIRILDKLQQKGVLFTDLNTVFVDVNVEIEGGVKIENNNTIKGLSIIKRGAVLKSNNIISNSVVSENAVLCGAFLKNTTIASGEVVLPYEKRIG